MASGTIGDTVTAGNNVTGAVADYGSIAAWHATLGTNETATGTIIRISAAVDTSTVTLSAGGTGTRTVTAHADAMLNAPTYSAATSRARVVPSSVNGFDVSGSGWVLEKFSIPNTVGGYCYCINTSAAVVARRMWLSTDTSDLGSRGFSQSAAVTSTLSNVAIGPVGQFGIINLDGTINCYQTSVLSDPGGGQRAAVLAVLGSSVINVYACVAQGVSTDGALFETLSGGTLGGDYNVSQDATAPGSSSTKYYRSTSGWFANTGAGTEDLSLAAGAQGKWVTDGKDAIDQTGWPADVATDIVGTSRAAPIDPGVWQTPAAAGGMLNKFAWLGGLGKPISSLTGGLHG